MIDPRITDLAAQVLTERQRRILEYRLAGHSWRTIGRALHISEATARGHHEAALRRLHQAQQENAA